MNSLRLVELDDPKVRSLAARIAPNARASTKAVLVGPFESFAIQALDWDTRILGMEAGRITEFDGAVSDQISYEGIGEILGALGLRYVTVRRPTAEGIRLRAFEAAGFRWVDGIVSFSKSKPFGGRTGSARTVKSDEGEIVAAIAVAAFTQSRFHIDEVMPAGAADRVHEQWAKNCCAKTAADEVLVIEDRGKIGGFITCKVISSGKVGVVDLVGVAPGSQGRGIGRALVDASCDWFERKGCESIQIQTQTDNFGAIRLYTSMGFVPDAAYVTLRWFSK